MYVFVIVCQKKTFKLLNWFRAIDSENILIFYKKFINPAGNAGNFVLLISYKCTKKKFSIKRKINYNKDVYLSTRKRIRKNFIFINNSPIYEEEPDLLNLAKNPCYDFPCNEYVKIQRTATQVMRALRICIFIRTFITIIFSVWIILFCMIDIKTETGGHTFDKKQT